MRGNRTRRQEGSNRDATTANSDGYSRRAVLGAVGSAGLAGIAGCLGFGDDGDDPASNDTDDSSPEEGPQPAVPTVEGPIDGGGRTGGPQTAAPHDLEPYDYVEEEYFVAGDARHDDFFLPDGEQSEDTAEFKTRILVYRPRQAETFNGSVYAEWLNVTTQVDAPVAWPNAYDSLMRNGTAVALVSAQKVGVDDSELDMDLATWDPERYGSLTHPGDEYALDIFAQAVNALVQGAQRDDGGSGNPDPMDGLEVENALATGHSQSAFYLLRYINMVVDTYGLLDGFVPAGSPLTTAQADQRPILWLNSVDEVGGLATFTEGSDAGDVDIPRTGLRTTEIEPGPRDDEEKFRLWEVAGASHVNVWLSMWAGAAQRRDFQGEAANWNPAVAGTYGESPDATYGECGANYFPARFAWRSALERLRVWVDEGEEPPAADRIARTTDDDGNPVPERDEDGNALGGLRLPTIDVPVATYQGSDCGLTGRTIRFDESTLAERYPTHQDYVDQMGTAIDAAVERGHLREHDGESLLARAEASPVGGD